MATPHCDYYSRHVMLGLGTSVLQVNRLGTLITTTSNYTSAGFNTNRTAIAQSYEHKEYPNINKMLSGTQQATCSYRRQLQWERVLEMFVGSYCDCRLRRYGPVHYTPTAVLHTQTVRPSSIHNYRHPTNSRSQARLLSPTTSHHYFLRSLKHS